MVSTKRGVPVPDDTKIAGEKSRSPGPKPRGDRTERLLWRGIAALLLASLLTVALLAYFSGRTRQSAPGTLSQSAADELAAVVRQNPTVPSAWSDYVKALIASGDYTGAQTAVQNGLSRTGGAAAVQVEQGRLLLQLGRVDEALKVLDSALRKAHQEVAATVEDLKKKGVTPRHLPNQVAIECLLLEAKAQSGQQRWQQAVDAYSGALAEDPTMADVLKERAQAYLELHRPADAAKDAQAVLRYQPNDPSALAILKTAKGGSR
jgi:tetratricopeptide (TPR) repeat protein